MQPVGHPIPHLDDPGACLEAIIDSTQEIPARVCAGCDFLHWAGRTFLPHTEKMAVNDFPALTEAELCAKIAELKSAKGGMQSWDWRSLALLVLSLLEKLLMN